jgi:CBS domain-containing protein
MSPGVSVGEVMRSQVVAVRERARFAEIVAAMRRFHISSLPVIDDLTYELDDAARGPRARL